MTEFDNTGVRLKTARIAAGFKSATVFCNKYKIPLSTYSLHETGGRGLKPSIAKRYAELLGVDTTWLLTGSGTPYNTTIQNSPISNNEFIELLKYQGSNKIKQSSIYKNERLNNVDPLVFCMIVIRMTKMLQSLNFHLAPYQFSKKIVEVYKDISTSSDDQNLQLNMIDLSITTFKRQIQESVDNNKKCVNE